MACECNCGKDKPTEEQKPADPNVEAAKQLEEETVAAVEAGTVEGE